jgi:hypothetical protein
MIDSKVEQWRKDGRHLPRFMRDFHDQKDIFKAMHSMTAVEKHEYAKDVSWVVGQCYVIDIFLWFMARHGYTLQRTPKKLPFEDLYENTKATNDADKARMAKLIFAAAPRP